MSPKQLMPKPKPEPIEIKVNLEKVRAPEEYCEYPAAAVYVNSF